MPGISRATLVMILISCLLTGTVLIPDASNAQQGGVIAPKAPIEPPPATEFDDSGPQPPSGPSSPGAPPASASPDGPVYFPARPPQHQASIPSSALDQAGPQYAFRPDLPNSEYGVCLNMERNWQDMWQAYARQYNFIMSMNPYDPRRNPMSWQLYYMKQQLDSMWANFRDKCIYFPERKTPSP